jgi:hypothetical protein
MRDKDKHRESQKRWHKEHPEKQKEYTKTWKTRHKEQMRKINREVQRRFRKENPEKVREYNREYMAKYRVGKYKLANDARQFVGQSWRRGLKTPSEHQRQKVFEKYGMSFEEMNNWLIAHDYNGKTNEVNHIVSLKVIIDFLVENKREVKLPLLIIFENMEVLQTIKNKKNWCRVLNKKQITVAKTLEKMFPIEFEGLEKHIQKLYDLDVETNTDKGSFK